MLNAMECITVANECRRLKMDLTARGFKRMLARLFEQEQKLTIVFDLKAGEFPKKSLFERMAVTADVLLQRGLETADYINISEKKRSPKNGTVSYTFEAKFDSAAPHWKLRSFLIDLQHLADACAAAEYQIAGMST